MMDIELKDLRMVSMIAATGNLTKAAARLNISQSALSRQLLDLEARLGVALFDRLPRQMRLTDVGQELLNIADEILTKIDQTEQSIARRLDGSSGELKLGIQCRPSFAWLPEIIREFQNRYPQVSVSAISTDDYMRDFNRGKIDLVVCHDVHDEAQKSLIYDHLFDEKIVVIMAPDHPLAGQELVLADFGRYDYIAPLARADDPFYNRILRPAGIEPKTFTVINHGETLMDMLTSGQGLALLPECFVKDWVASGKLIQTVIADVPITSSWLIGYKEKPALPQAASAFIALVRERMGEPQD